MKITLISTYPRPFALGLRYVSSSLKAAGYDVEMLFMSSRRDTARADFSPPLLEDFARRLRDCDVIGMSLMTNSFHRARVLTRYVRDAGIPAPIVWGGVHPTLAPDECLEHADAVCIGEGDEAMRQLVDRMVAGRDPTDAPSMRFRVGSRFGNRDPVQNTMAPLKTDLDALPPPDYELETHWVVDGDALVPARADNLRGPLHSFNVLSSRGCPFRCTFCNNSALRAAHDGAGKWVRLRSLENVLGEMRQALACFPTVEAMHIVDDLFFVHPAEEIEAFARVYNADVGLPLIVQVSPTTVTDRKVRAMAGVPLKSFAMGIQSGSEDTLYNIYDRPTPPRRIAEAMDVIARHEVPAEYHYIVSNPFEPEENLIETLRFIASHHRRAKLLHVFPLMLYPGTPLYDQARSAGLIDKRHDFAYDHETTHAGQMVLRDYLSIWVRIVLGMKNAGVPGWLVHRVIDVATAPSVRRVCRRKWVTGGALRAYRIIRKVTRNLIYQPIVKPFKYLRTKPRRRPREVAASRWTVKPAAPPFVSSP